MKYPRIKHDAESLKYNLCAISAWYQGQIADRAALGHKLTTLKPGSSMGINPNRHIIWCMRAMRETMAAFGCKNQ
jgi:hypothetical protein